jgi:hypothetical protein
VAQGYAVVDVETTGLHPGWRHWVVEVAVVRLHPPTRTTSSEIQETGLWGWRTGQPRLAAGQRENQCPHAHGDRLSRVALGDRLSFRRRRSGAECESRRCRPSHGRIVVSANFGGARKW